MIKSLTVLTTLALITLATTITTAHTTAHASTTAHDSIIIHSISHHSSERHKGGEPDQYNEVNYSLGYEHRSGWSTGVYKDSYGTPAIWVKRTIITAKWPRAHIQAGYSFGVVSSKGYKQELNLDVVPLILPEIRIGKYINIIMLPLGGSSIYGIQFKIPLGR